MGVYIKGITIDDFIEQGGEYAAYLAGTGQADEVSDHGRLIDGDRLQRIMRSDRVLSLREAYEWLQRALDYQTVIPKDREEGLSNDRNLY